MARARRPPQPEARRRRRGRLGARGEGEKAQGLTVWRGRGGVGAGGGGEKAQGLTVWREWSLGRPGVGRRGAHSGEADGCRGEGRDPIRSARGVSAQIGGGKRQGGARRSSRTSPRPPV